jgi:23S rRNA pseudouridine2605 synthase
MNASDTPENPVEPTADAADAGAAAPKRRRSPARKTVVEAAVEAPPVAAEAPAAPAKPRTRRRKVDEVSAEGAESAAPAVAEPTPAAPAVEPVAEPVAEAPARKRAPRRKAAESVVPSMGVESAEVVEPAAPVAEPVPAPVDAAEAAEGAPQAEARPAGRGRRRPARADAAVTSADAAPTHAAADAPVEPAVDGDAGDAGDDSADARGDGAGSRRRERRERLHRERPDRVPDEDFHVVTVPARDDEAEEEAVEAPAGRVIVGDVGETFASVLSGDYDAEPAADVDAEVERRVLAPEPDAPKLHKVLAQAGIGSRRDMEQLIVDGRVTVNGQVAHTGQRVSFGDRIAVGGKVIKVRINPLPARVIAYHKVVGEVVTHDDPQHRPTVFRRLPRLPQGKWQSVGRLDINTEGLLLFTNSGELANQLMHPRFGVEREYAVRTLGSLDSEAREKLLAGVEIDGQRAGFKSIEDGGGEGVNRWYRVVITEGRNREVRKLFDKVGLGVSRLIRIRYGCVVLPRGLKRGVWVDLSRDEVADLRYLASAPQRGGRPQPVESDGEREALPPRGPAKGRHGNKPARGPGAVGRGDGAPMGAAPQGKGPQGGGQNRGGKGPRQGEGRPGERQGERQGERPVDRIQADRKPQEPRARREPRESDEFARIPNPLMQTFDKRAIREAHQPRRQWDEDGPIPNPLEQTYDKRFVQKSNPFGGKRKGGGGAGGNGGQPDPMKTAVGYIGADAFVRKFQGFGSGGNGGGGGGNGGGGGGGGGGGNGGNKRRRGPR